VMTPAAFFHGGPVNGWRIRWYLQVRSAKSEVWAAVAL